jgi:hypothetical protein
MKKIALFLSILSLLPFASFAIGKYNSNEELFVLASSGLRLRDKPDGKILDAVPYGSKITTLEAKNAKFPAEVEGIKGSWVKVQFGKTQGYVFDGFLSKLPAPKEGATFKEYITETFKPTSERMLSSFSPYSGMEGSSDTYFQIFKYKNLDIVYTEATYYEGGSEEMCLKGVSMEEGYLIARVLFKKDYEQFVEEMKTYVPVEGETPRDMTPYSKFVLNAGGTLEEDGTYSSPHTFYEAELTMECYYGVKVAEKDGYMIISVGGGC